jgi:hypothetical protein
MYCYSKANQTIRLGVPISRAKGVGGAGNFYEPTYLPTYCTYSHSSGCVFQGSSRLTSCHHRRGPSVYRERNFSLLRCLPAFLGSFLVCKMAPLMTPFPSTFLFSFSARLPLFCSYAAVRTAAWFTSASHTPIQTLGNLGKVISRVRWRLLPSTALL